MIAGAASGGRWAIITGEGSIATRRRSAGSYEPVPAPTLTTVTASPSARGSRRRCRGSSRRVVVYADAEAVVERAARSPRPAAAAMKRTASACSSASCWTERWWPPGTTSIRLVGRGGVERARVLDRHVLVALGVHEQQRARRARRAAAARSVVARAARSSASGVGAEREAPVRAARARSCAPRRRADRHDRGRAERGARGERQPAAHARPAQRDRRRRPGSSAGDRRDVVDRAAVERAVALAVPALVEGDRGEAGAAARAREVEVVLLLRAGAVDDHDAAGAASPSRQEQRVGEAVALAGSVGPGGLPAWTARIDTDSNATPAMAAAVRSSRPPTRSAAASTDDGRLEIGGCDALELAREFGTPAYRRGRGRHPRARARVPGGVRRAHRRLRGPLRLQGVPVHRGPAAHGRGGAGVRRRRRAASCTWRSRPASTPARIHLHGNAKSRRELQRGPRRGRRPRRARQRPRHRAARGDRRRPASARPCRCGSRPGVSPDTHPSISTGGPNTKFGFNLDAAPRRDRARHGLRQARPRGPALPHRLADRRPRAVPPGDRGARRPRRLPRCTTSAAASASPTPSTTHPPTIEDYVAFKVDAVEQIAGPGKRILDEPGRALVANSTVTLYTRRVGQAQRR